MEAASMVGNFGLPPGFAFVPKDEEVVACYLVPRLQGQRLPIDGVILEDDPLSAPPWKLLKKHGRKGDAFFFAAGQAMNVKGSRQKRRCAGGGTWDGQKKVRGGRDGEKLRVPGSGMEVAWHKYALSFQEDGVEGSTGWVMHEYSISAPPKLAASPLRVYRIRFSGHGKNAKKRKKDGHDSDGDDAAPAHGATTRPAVSETAVFVGECPSASQSARSSPDGADVGASGAVPASTLLEEDLSSILDNWSPDLEAVGNMTTFRVLGMSCGSPIRPRHERLVLEQISMWMPGWCWPGA